MLIVALSEAREDVIVEYDCATLDMLKKARELLFEDPSSRSLSMTLNKVDEAIMWREIDLKQKMEWKHAG